MCRCMQLSGAINISNRRQQGSCKERTLEDPWRQLRPCYLSADKDPTDRVLGRFKVLLVRFDSMITAVMASNLAHDSAIPDDYNTCLPFPSDDQHNLHRESNPAAHFDPHEAESLQQTLTFTKYELDYNLEHTRPSFAGQTLFQQPLPSQQPVTPNFEWPLAIHLLPLVQPPLVQPPLIQPPLVQPPSTEEIFVSNEQYSHSMSFAPKDVSLHRIGPLNSFNLPRPITIPQPRNLSVARSCTTCWAMKKQVGIWIYYV